MSQTVATNSNEIDNSGFTGFCKRIFGEIWKHRMIIMLVTRSLDQRKRSLSGILVMDVKNKKIALKKTSVFLRLLLQQITE